LLPSLFLHHVPLAAVTASEDGGGLGATASVSFSTAGGLTVHW
jgi:hypothetical protein